jgi:hypothetical protein
MIPKYLKVKVNNVEMNQRKIMYIAISAVCVLAIIAAIFEQFTLSKGSKNNNNIKEEVVAEKTQEELKREFNSLFNNEISYNNYETSNIKRTDVSKEIVYTAYDINKTEENKYEVEIHLPVINISNDVAIGFNKITQSIFADKATEVLNNNSGETIIYNVEYTGYVNGDVLSVIIKSTLKQGANPQRIIVQTYNYNLKTGNEVTIYDAIKQRNVSESDVSTKIQKQILNAISEANSLQATGYEIYSRDITSEIYTVANSENFFFGPDGKLYIIYAYGNNNYTSEMDIIEI